MKESIIRELYEDSLSRSELIMPERDQVSDLQ